MFSIVRLFIGFVFLGCSVLLIKKANTIHKRIKYIACTVASITLITVLAFLPFENLFLNFGSPKEAYEYYSLGKSNIELVLEGNDCAFIIDCENDKENILIIPKSEDGWKIGIGSDTKKIFQKNYDGFTACVYQYKNSNDYFITILGTNGGELIISDNYNTEFHSLERYNNSMDKIFVTYYAHVPKFDLEYNLTVNGSEIVFDR